MDYSNMLNLEVTSPHSSTRLNEYSNDHYSGKAGLT